MTPILVALLTAGGVLVVGWLLVSGRRVASQTRVRRSAGMRSNILDAGDAHDADWIYGDRAARERRARGIASESREADQQLPFEGKESTQTLSAKGKADAILRDAELRAAEILEHAQKERETLLEERLAAAERAALEKNDKAEQEAAAIVKNAELQAGEVLVEVERARARLEQEMQELAREQARMAAKHERLSEFLLTALEEIERASPNGSTKIGGLQELRDELQSTE
jgi:cell division septum initiation protein DivIVA